MPDESALPGTVAGNHTGLALYSGSESVWWSKLGNNIRRSLSPEFQTLKPDAFRDVFQQHLELCVSTAERYGCTSIILSNEHLSERLDKALITTFSESIRPLFSKTIVLVYLREQAHACVSLYGDSLKHGNSSDFGTFIKSHSTQRLMDYCSLLHNWEECGWEVRPIIYYEMGHRPPTWGLISTFATAIQDESISQILPKIEETYKLNTSIPPDAFFIKLILNKLNLSVNIQPIIQYRLLRTAVKAPFLKGRFRKRNAAQLGFLSRLCINGNRAVAEKYFNKADLFGVGGR